MFGNSEPAYGPREEAKARFRSFRLGRTWRVDHVHLIRMLVDVRWFKTIVTAVLLVLWVPATSHALLEQAGWIHIPHGDADNASGTDNDNDHDAADGICHVASTQVQVPQSDLAGSPASQALMEFSFVVTASNALSSATLKGPDPPGAAPPELAHIWQFSFRASLPPRAPSLLS